MRIIIRRWFRNIFASSCKSWAFWLSKFFFCLDGASSEDTNDDCKIALIIYLFEAGLVSLGCLIMLKVYNDYKTPCHGAKIKSGCWRQKIIHLKLFRIPPSIYIRKTSMFGNLKLQLIYFGIDIRQRTQYVPHTHRHTTFK